MSEHFHFIFSKCQAHSDRSNISCMTFWRRKCWKPRAARSHKINEYSTYRTNIKGECTLFILGLPRQRCHLQQLALVDQYCVLTTPPYTKLCFLLSNVSTPRKHLFLADEFHIFVENFHGPKQNSRKMGLFVRATTKAGKIVRYDARYNIEMEIYILCWYK